MLNSSVKSLKEKMLGCSWWRSEEMAVPFRIAARKSPSMKVCASVDYALAVYIVQLQQLGVLGLVLLLDFSLPLLLLFFLFNLHSLPHLS